MSRDEVAASRHMTSQCHAESVYCVNNEMTDSSGSALLRNASIPDMLPRSVGLAMNQNNNSSCDDMAAAQTAVVANDNSHSTFKQQSSTCCSNDDNESKRTADCNDCQANSQQIDNELNELLHATDYAGGNRAINDVKTQVVRPLPVPSILAAVPAVKLPPSKTEIRSQSLCMND